MNDANSAIPKIIKKLPNKICCCLESLNDMGLRGALGLAAAFLGAVFFFAIQKLGCQSFKNTNMERKKVAFMFTVCA